MTDQSEPGHPPAPDLAAFDVSRQSPEQIAQAFVRWKTQRKRHPQDEPARDSQPPASAPAASGAMCDPAPPPEKMADAAQATAKRAHSVRYSTSFSALLAAGSEPAVARDAWAPVARLTSPKRNPPRGRRLQVLSVLAGIASIFAVGGGALLEQSARRGPSEAEPEIAQVHPLDIPSAGSLLPAATTMPAAEWQLRRTVDLALIKAEHAVETAAQPAPRPSVPPAQTASKAAPPPTEGKPTRDSVAPATPQFVAKPFVPSVAPTPAPIAATRETASIPAPPVAAAVRRGDPRPDALFQHGRDGGNGALGDRVASGGKPASATGSEGAADTRPAARSSTVGGNPVGSGTVAGRGSGDPRGEGSGGARPAAVGGETGGGDTGDVSDDSGNTGDGGATGAGSSAGETDGGDTGAGSGSSETDGASSDGSVSANGSGDGEASDGDSGDGDSDPDNGEDGNPDGIGGALEGVGDALGDALGGGNPEGEDKDQRD